MLKVIKFFLIILTAAVLPASVFAQSAHGKLAGKITDADTGEPLIGANIVVINTNYGGAADIEGNYYILNIPPGTYDVRLSYVGYGQKLIKDVRIVAGVTYELNESLKSGIQIDEIVVTDKKFFEEKATNTIKVIDADQIRKIPVKGVSNIVSLQAGVVVRDGSGGADGNATINVRGGRGGEVLYIVDGVPQNSIYTQGNASQISNNAIEQISFQVGGYEAKYGQAQSGIVNVTTRTGSPKYSFFGEVRSSEFTDSYGHNLYSAGISGPYIPGNPNHTLFLSAEREWFLDPTPPAIDYDITSIGQTYDYTPENSAGVWRFSGRSSHNLGNFALRLGSNMNFRSGRVFIFRYLKNNSKFMPAFDQNNLTFNGKISHNIANNAFWNLTAGFRRLYFEQYHPIFKDDLLKYGDKDLLASMGVDYTLSNTRNLSSGMTIPVDQNRVFFLYGRVQNLYSKRQEDSYTLDFDMTYQYNKHLFEIGAGMNYGLLRVYQINPIALMLPEAQAKDLYARYVDVTPVVFGYNIYGTNTVGMNFSDRNMRPKNPVTYYAYLQDRYELQDLVLNIGVRMDYFTTNELVLKDPSLPIAAGNPAIVDDADLKEKESELEFSPRIGVGFPITESTVFHAQYGRFVQQPALNDLYNGPFDLAGFEPGGFDPQYIRDGSIKCEQTTQYELGFRQVIGDHTALNITAFYKNVVGLVNRQNNYWQQTVGGQTRTYIAPANSDFGTTKGVALSVDVQRMSYFNISAQYTYSIAEGTGSSTNSSQTSVFRNQDNAAPKVIAPLDFDQRHTAVINIDFFVPKGQMGFLEMFNINALISFNSGRPYTPMDKWDLLGDNGIIATTSGYINSRYMPGTFRIDLKVEKSFEFNNLTISPYIWIENLLDADNVINVYRSTGNATTTNWLNTTDGMAAVANNGEGYKQDYIALENDPSNFGVPRMIKLGVRMNFANLTF